MTAPLPHAVYDAGVRHVRRADPPHVVDARLRLVLVDLADLDRLDPHGRLQPGWRGRVSPFRLRRRDVLHGRDDPLGPAVRDLVADHLGRRPCGRIRLLTQPRTLGWLFTPLSVYLCDDPDGGLDAVVLEVTNTPWHERHWYVLDARGGAVDAVVPKAFHVSPFLPMDLTYRCRVDPPGERLALRLELRHAPDAAPIFTATLTGRRRDPQAPRRPTEVVSSLTQTWRTSLGIYAHAAALLARRARLHRHPRTSDRPHPHPPAHADA